MEVPMKRVTLLSLALLAACAPTPPPRAAVPTPPPESGTPKWVNRGSGAYDGEHGKCFYGVGVVNGIRNPALARQTADNRARGEIAKIFDLYIASMMKDYQRSTTAGNFKASAEEQDVVSAQKTITETSLPGIEVRDHYTDPATGSIFALAVLDLEGMGKALGSAKQLDARVTGFVRDNSRRAFEDLDRELRRRDHPKLPTCAPDAQFTYVIDDQARISTFDPQSATPLKQKGTLSCPVPGHPFSMGVRHDGIAYVLFIRDPNRCSGMARVDLNTLSCQAVPGFTCQPPPILDRFGMAYSMAGPSGAETLFASGMTSTRLAHLDPESGRFTTVGELPATAIETTGNPEGAYWGFSPEGSPQAFHLDPATGARLQAFPLDIPTTARPMARSWAFASWGGAFYIFYGEHESSGGTSVYRLTPDGKLTTFLSRTGVNIVGAGNAVCAGSVRTRGER
jgi:hypothetical protein